MTKKYASRRVALDFTHSEPSDFRAPVAREDRNVNRAARRIARLHDKPFVVWDGEGARREGRRKPQDYILFGMYDGISHDYIRSERLTTHECLQFIIRMGREHSDAWHVGFAFGYDVNMILRSMSPKSFKFLNERGYCRFGDNYRIEHIPGKWFRVTEFGSTYPLNRQDRFTVTIFDVWGFFQSSLVKALKANIADHPLMVHLTEIEAGKDKRSEFTYDQFDFILKYWEIENVLLFALVNRLREMLYAVGFYISSWHGPGALASYVYRTHGVAKHKSDCGPDIYDAARRAYAGGRFERFHVGRYEKAFGYDINSAYPHAISQLPSLTEGTWNYVSEPKRIVEFGIYRIRLHGPAISRRPSPLFHRDKQGNISYPWRVDGWYWSPEVSALIDTLSANDGVRVEILEAWEYTGWRTRPFAFVRDAYAERRRMKVEGIGAQMALKLMLNSLYGKMAQRAGWERSGKAPTWHQLEWAGWVTSYTRAQLYRLMCKMQWEQLIAVETDGIYSTATPEQLGIVDSKELGEWEINEYDELTYLQSGIYAACKSNDWTVKYRGLDKDSFGKTASDAANAIVSHAMALGPTVEWPPIVGTTTRFIGYTNALFREQQSRGPFKVHHCVWETEPREIDCGTVGKRVHSPRICVACAASHNAYEQPHETIIKSRAGVSFDSDDVVSQPHDIPWLDNKRMDKWREYMLSQEGLLRSD